MAQLPGYARGLVFLGAYAFVGLSKIRQTATSAGLPIAENLDSLKCGVAVIDLATGTIAALLEWHSGIEEIFDVRLNTFSRVSIPLGSPFPGPTEPTRSGWFRLRGMTSASLTRSSPTFSPWR